MLQTIFNKLEEILKKDERLVSDDGRLLKNKAVELANKLDEDLVKILHGSAELKDTFFKKVGDLILFDKDLFVEFVSNKEFLPDSYTAFKNKIGLAVGRDYLKQDKEVTLVWPYKDCVLEGGQTKEEAKRGEIFWNTTLAPDEINRLLEPKVLTNWTRYDKYNIKKGRKADEIRDTDNLIIKGNNLLALHSLKRRYNGRVNLIYIDPPYNTGNDSFGYNDNFNHSTWLTFMQNRLDVAKDLLAPSGVIFVQCDATEAAYLKVLMDEIFQRDNFLNDILVQAKTVAGASGGGEDKSLKKNTEHILFYAKDKAYLEYYNNTVEIPLFSLIKEKENIGKSYEYDQVLVDFGEKGKKVGTIKTRSGDVDVFAHNDFEIKTVKQVAKEEKISIYEVYGKYLDKIFRTQDSQSSIRHKVRDITGNGADKIYSILYVPDSGKNKGKETRVLYFKGEQVNFLSSTTKVENDEIIKIRPLGSLWADIGWDGIANEGGVKMKNGKKPEKLLKRIIDLSTKIGDIVLDYHAGSGTTGAVAHKMQRQYILIEQMDYIHDLPEARLKNVIEGDQTGVSKAIGWKGGGSFVYTELMPLNEKFVREVENAKSTKEVLKIWEAIQKNGFVSYRVDPKKFDENAKDFADLDLVKQKKFVLESLDANMLYVNYGDIDDKEYAVGADDKKLNKEFYGNAPSRI